MSSHLTNNRIGPFFYFLFVLASVLIIAPLFQQGLFIDGLIYKTVSNNYFTGEGSFWKMKFNDVSMNPFYEQPPLFFFVTGSFYKLFGNSFLSDRILTVILLGISALLLLQICKHFFAEYKKAFAINCFLLLAVPVVCWAFVNQVIETLVLPLTLLAFYCFLQFKKGAKFTARQLIWLLGFSFSGVLLFLTKGFQSCFILTAPFLYFIFLRDRKSLVFGLLSLALFSAFMYFILSVHTPSKLWFDNYLQKRLLASLNNIGATTTYRAEIIIRIFTELIVAIVLVLIGIFYTKFKKEKVERTSNENKTALILLLIAFFGSVPFSITLEQRGFYLVPSFPFYVLAIVIYFKDLFFKYYEMVNNFFCKKAVSIALLVLFIASLGYWIMSPTLYKRDENLINDLKLITPFIKAQDTVAIDEDTWNHTSLQSYLYLMKRVDVECKYSHRFYIHDREHNTVPNANYKKVEIPVKQFDLFELDK